MGARDAVTVEAAGREVEISSPAKVFFPQRGDTKLDLARYPLPVEAPATSVLPLAYRKNPSTPNCPVIR